MDVRGFAQRVHFYSGMAYKVVREVLNLPAPRTLRRWSSGIDANPGWTDVSFYAIKKYVQSMSKPLLLTLMLDGMSIQKHASYDKLNDKFVG